MKFSKHFTVGILVYLFCSFLAVAGGGKDNPLNIKVTGFATINLPVDHVNISIDITIKDPKNQLYTKLQSDKVVKQILSIAKVFSITDKDIDASYISIGPDEVYDNNKESYVKKGYVSNRTVDLTLRDLDKLDDLLSKIVEINSIEISSLSFSSDKYDKKKEEELLNLAVKNARQQAEIISKALDLNLGKILQVSLIDDSYNSDCFDYESDFSNDSESIKNSFLKKNTSFFKSINITYELKE